MDICQICPPSSEHWVMRAAWPGSFGSLPERIHRFVWGRARPPHAYNTYTVDRSPTLFDASVPSMNFLATLRYLVFAVFIVCNAILSSVAVWNSSLVPSSSRHFHTDTYIVVVGALGLALTFTRIFVELVRRNAFTSRVWFEILWTTTFFGLDLGGAIILSAVGLADACKPATIQSRKSQPQSLPPGACSSSHVLMGFTWLCTFILHNFPPLTSRRSNAPVSSFLPRFTQDKAPMVASPVPRRPNTVPPALYTLRSVGLDSQYQIEHFQPPTRTFDHPLPSSPVTSPAHYLHMNPSNAGNVQAAVALYPQFLSSAYVTQLPPARTQPPPTPLHPSRRPSRSPPPLGDWPRADAPLRIKRKHPPSMGLEDQIAAGLAPSRPMGPRTRAGPTDTRPPALDLSSINRRRDPDRNV
ncbi:hypothetical protein B0H12DRAFT_500211 [Mycena haematopus]|nr:hypothetical protein B0H12DRAFT_500211 [Mycena haematopus]